MLPISDQTPKTDTQTVPEQQSTGTTSAPTMEEIAKRFDIDDKFPEFQGWESIGFHRGLGREFWQFAVEIVSLVFSIFLLSLLMPILNPYPQIAGYQNVAAGLFAIVYMVFDMGTNFNLGRFIAEYRIKSVKKMLQYVSFTIWWQSFTGLVQVTILSWFTFEIIVKGEYAYLTWILLIGLQKQFPGWFGVFYRCIEGLQHYDKAEIIRFFQGQIAERVSLIGFVLYFRWYGTNHPEMGLLMGIIIGTVIGNYLDDVGFEFLSAYFLNNILKKYYGLSIRDAFKISYDKDVMHDIIYYSVQGSILPLIGSAVNTYVFFTYIGNIGAYTTWVAIIATGMTMANQIRQFGDMSIQNSIAEAYPSGKCKLSEFYVSYSMKWRYLFMLLIAFIIVGIIPYFTLLVKSLKAFEYYQGAELFIIAGVILRLADPFTTLPDSIMNGANTPKTNSITIFNVIRVIEEVSKVFFTWYFVVYLRVQETWGLFGLVFLLGFQNWVPRIIKTILCYIYIAKKIMHVKFYWISTFILPTVGSIPMVFIARFWFVTGFQWLRSLLGLEFALVVSILLLVVVVLTTYFPIIVLLGGFDDYQLFVFKKALSLAGPSKPIFAFVFKLMQISLKFARKIRMHGRFPIPFEEAHREIHELMELKRQSLKTHPTS